MGVSILFNIFLRLVYELPSLLNKNERFFYNGVTFSPLKGSKSLKHLLEVFEKCEVADR